MTPLILYVRISRVLQGSLVDTPALNNEKIDNSVTDQRDADTYIHSRVLTSRAGDYYVVVSDTSNEMC